MGGVTISRVETIRLAVILSVLLLFTAAPVIGLMYGTTGALTIGSLTLISPLELLLVILGMKAIPLGLIVPGLITIFIIVVFGRFFCGWICPVGIILEYSLLLSNRKNRNMLGALKRNWERYAILLAVLGASLIFSFSLPYLFSPPGIIYRPIIQYMIQGIIGADLAVLVFIIVLDVLAARYGRTWCNTICPLGTLISSLGFINLIRPRIDRKKCIKFDSGCNRCENVCPMRIPLTKTGKLGMMSCHKCLKCWRDCPTNAIGIKLF